MRPLTPLRGIGSDPGEADFWDTYHQKVRDRQAAGGVGMSSAWKPYPPPTPAEQAEEARYRRHMNRMPGLPDNVDPRVDPGVAEWPPTENVGVDYAGVGQTIPQLLLGLNAAQGAGDQSQVAAILQALQGMQSATPVAQQAPAPEAPAVAPPAEPPTPRDQEAPPEKKKAGTDWGRLLATAGGIGLMGAGDNPALQAQALHGMNRTAERREAREIARQSAQQVSTLAATASALAQKGKFEDAASLLTQAAARAETPEAARAIQSLAESVTKRGLEHADRIAFTQGLDVARSQGFDALIKNPVPGLSPAHYKTIGDMTAPKPVTLREGDISGRTDPLTGMTSLSGPSIPKVGFNEGAPYQFTYDQATGRWGFNTATCPKATLAAKDFQSEFKTAAAQEGVDFTQYLEDLNSGDPQRMLLAQQAANQISARAKREYLSTKGLLTGVHAEVARANGVDTSKPAHERSFYEANTAAVAITGYESLLKASEYQAKSAAERQMALSLPANATFKEGKFFDTKTLGEVNPALPLSEIQARMLRGEIVHTSDKDAEVIRESKNTQALTDAWAALAQRVLTHGGAGTNFLKAGENYLKTKGATSQDLAAWESFKAQKLQIARGLADARFSDTDLQTASMAVPSDFDSAKTAAMKFKVFQALNRNRALVRVGRDPEPIPLADRQELEIEFKKKIVVR